MVKPAVILSLIATLLPGLSVAQNGAAGGGVPPVAPPPVTMVWVTRTNAAGVVETLQTPYTQSFRDPAPMINLKVGTIGLGKWGDQKLRVRDEPDLAKKTPMPTIDRHKRCSHGHCH